MTTVEGRGRLQITRGLGDVGNEIEHLGSFALSFLFPAFLLGFPSFNILYFARPHPCADPPPKTSP